MTCHADNGRSSSTTTTATYRQAQPLEWNSSGSSRSAQPHPAFSRVGGAIQKYNTPPNGGYPVRAGKPDKALDKSPVESLLLPCCACVWVWLSLLPKISRHYVVSWVSHEMERIVLGYRRARYSVICGCSDLCR